MFNIKIERESIIIFGNVYGNNIEEVFIALNEVSENKITYGLKIIFVDSICMTSSLIRQLLKFQEDHTYLRVVVGNKEVYNLLNSLDLATRLKVSYKSTQNY